VVYVGVAYGNRINAPFFIYSACMQQVVCSVQAWLVRKHPQLLIMRQDVAEFWLEKAAEVIKHHLEAQAKIKENACAVILNQKLVATYIIYSAKESYAGH
jgi:hypothetical protein